MKKIAIIFVFLAGCSSNTNQISNVSTSSSVSSSSEVSSYMSYSINSSSIENILKDYIWLSIQEAKTLAQGQNRQFRLVEIDWEPQTVTMDIIEWRINAKSKDWKIIETSVESYLVSE